MVRARKGVNQSYFLYMPLCDNNYVNCLKGKNTLANGTKSQKTTEHKILTFADRAIPFCPSVETDDCANSCPSKDPLERLKIHKDCVQVIDLNSGTVSNEYNTLH